MFLLAKVLQAFGFADVSVGLFLGITRGDMWTELYMTLSGIAFFMVGRLLEPRG